MSTRILLGLGLGALSLACGAKPPAAPVSGGPVVPVLRLDEAQDEWLHDACAYTGLAETSEDLVQAEARARRANLAEMVYKAGRTQNVVFFRCAAPPRWFVGNWVPLEP